MIIAIIPAIVPVLLLLGGAGGLWAWIASTDDPNKKLPKGKKPRMPPKPKPTEPKPTDSSPFKMTDVAGEGTLQIMDAYATYALAANTAAENGATSDANAEDVLRSLEKSLAGGKSIGTVQVIEDPTLPLASWVDILSDASQMTWGELDAKVSAWLVAKGLG